MKIVVFILIAIVLLLQYPLWFGSGSVANLWRLEREIAAQEEENALLRERNAALEAEVVDLKTGLEAIEERARAELGMVKKDEAFYQIIEQTRPPAARREAPKPPTKPAN